MSKKTKCDLILDYMNRNNGRITTIEAIREASTTSPHKFLQYLVQRGIVRSDKTENASYHIYTLVDKQLKLL